MLRTALLLLLVFHGLIHLMGSAKAFGWAGVPALTKPISRPMGARWALAALLFCASAGLLLLGHDRWWMPGAAAVVLSQALIIAYGRDARFGTVANVLLGLAVVVAASSWNFRRGYTEAAASAVRRSLAEPEKRITEADLSGLPLPVQRYLRASGAMGRTRPRNMRLAFEGSIRSTTGPWMPFTTVQTNTFDTPARFFWMDATMKSLPTKGFHAYDDGTATMRIKLLGLFSVMEAHGPEMDTAETVTWFNDLCLFAPGALLDERITWSAIDDHQAKATFTHKGIRISAVLVFDAEDHLIDFISDDRYALLDGRPPRKYRFSTPASEHGPIGGLVLPHYGETVWMLPEGPFTYGRFRLKSVEVDVREQRSGPARLNAR
jgi:hypothetical protein